MYIGSFYDLEAHEPYVEEGNREEQNTDWIDTQQFDEEDE